MIYGFAPDAVCRDENGRVFKDRIPPAILEGRPAAAKAGPYDLVKLTDKIGGEDCYFHRVEVNLEPSPAACTVATVNGPSTKVAGTRGDLNCSAK